MSKVHFRLSPSAAYRWSACPGSLKQTEGEVSQSSVYAEEGTQAHSVAEQLASAAVNIGENWPEYISELQLKEGQNQEMVDNAARYAAVICETIKHAEANGHELIDFDLELSLVHSTIPDFGGTADCCLIFRRPDGSHDAWVIDYKYGTGTIVEAEGNLQLLAYATLLADHYKYPRLEFFGGVIVQPRATQTGDGGVRYTQFGLADVSAFEKLCIRASQSEELLTGDHCRWCPARTKCPALLEKARKAVTQQDNLSAEEQHQRWIELLELAPALKSLLDEIPKKMIEAIRLGADFPGYKVVESVGHRAWKFPDEQILRALKKYGLAKKACLTDPVLKSPAQVEKILSDKEVLEALVERPKRGLTIAKSNDRRPAVEFSEPEEIPVGDIPL